MKHIEIEQIQKVKKKNNNKMKYNNKKAKNENGMTLKFERVWSIFRKCKNNCLI